MNLRVSDPKVGAGWVGTGKAVGRDAFWRAAPALELTPRSNQWRQWQCGWRQGELAAARWTSVGGARFEEALDRGRGRSSVHVRVTLTPTIPQEHHPERTAYQCTDQRAEGSSHPDSFG
jgi:hypothetical protein